MGRTRRAAGFGGWPHTVLARGRSARRGNCEDDRVEHTTRTPISFGFTGGMCLRAASCQRHPSALILLDPRRGGQAQCGPRISIERQQDKVARTGRRCIDRGDRNGPLGERQDSSCPRQCGTCRRYAVFPSLFLSSRPRSRRRQGCWLRGRPSAFRCIFVN
jgi:hypothetical protein